MLFADRGLSDAQISVLLAIWSLTAVVFEVPSGALADRFSRRGSLVVAGVLQAAGYGAWVLFPSFWGFAAGFVLWGLGGTLTSGAFEALLYDGLAANGDEDRYGRLNARVDTIELIAQVPVAVVATALFSFGGYELAGWASVAMCLASSVIALRFPEPERGSEDDDEPGYFATLRTGLREAIPIRRAVLAVALVYALDAFEEYFTLLAQDWDVPTVWVPMATIGIPLMGAVGASLAGRLPFRGWVLFASGALLIVAAWLAVPCGDRPAGTVLRPVPVRAGARGNRAPAPDRVRFPCDCHVRGRDRLGVRGVRGLRTVGAGLGHRHRCAGPGGGGGDPTPMRLSGGVRGEGVGHRCPRGTPRSRAPRRTPSACSPAAGR